MSANPTIITLRLTEEEEYLIAALAQERGLSTPADVLRALLHDATEIYDALWDKTLEASQDVLDKLADEAHEEYLAGLTEDFDPDSDPDAV
jgi:predicted HD phosphohydrolase